MKPAADGVAAGGGEDAGEACGGGVVRGVVRPEAEDAAGLQVAGDAGEAFVGVERRVPGREKRLRRMVDVDQDAVEHPPRPVGIEAVGRGGESEEVALDQPTAGIARDPGPEGQDALAVPVDHGGQRVDDDQARDLGVIEGGGGGVAETEAADHDVGRGGREVGQREAGERALAAGDREGVRVQPVAVPARVRGAEAQPVVELAVVRGLPHEAEAGVVDEIREGRRAAVLGARRLDEFALTAETLFASVVGVLSDPTLK